MAKTPLPPGSTIGIVGGGQLGRMMVQAASRLGYHTHIFTPEHNSPAAELATHTTVADYTDNEALRHFASEVDVVTYEFENIPLAAIELLASQISVCPSPQILATTQHRIKEKQSLNALGIKTAPFTPVHSKHALQEAVKAIGLPSVLKTCTMGYDGKGQWTLKNEQDVTNCHAAIRGSEGAVSKPQDPALPGGPQDDTMEMILEGFVPFGMEISVIVARDTHGNIACYDPVQNIHKNHILHQTIAPAPISETLADKAQNMACDIAEGMKLVGLMAIEMFVVGEDILVNELAPRPHNSGHWTIDACITSQFEQTIRAVCGLPLGMPDRLCGAKMLNLIGPDVHDWSRYVGEPNAKLHLYGKREVRAGRKMGHVTFLDTGQK